MSSSGKLTILFAMLSEVGHHNGTFKLAKALRDRGHRIVYLGLPNVEALVRSQGFEFISFAKDLFARGRGGTAGGFRVGHGWGPLEWLLKRQLDERFFAEYLDRINNGQLDERLQSCKPDLLLCDTFVWYIALRALRLGIPTVSISIILSLYGNAGVPPIISAIYPKQTWWYPIQVLACWGWMRVKFLFTKKLASLFLGAYRAPVRMHHLVDEFRRIAKRAAYPLKENKTYWFGEIGPRLVLPEIVLCPQAFQLPNSPNDGRRYLGDFVDLERQEEPLPEQAIDFDKPLIYCSLGSAASAYPHSLRFCKAVIHLSELRKDWQFVLHLGSFREPEALGPFRSNIFIAGQVPQLALLRKASVMVTHGGINSIMECIQFQVPMVIVPGMRDQPGNAVRAAFYDLAVTGDMADITAEKLMDLVANAMGDGRIRAGLAHMKDAIAREKGLQGCLRFIEDEGCRQKSEGRGSQISSVRAV